MTVTAAPPIQRAFVVYWHDLDRWIVPSSTMNFGQLPEDWAWAKVGEIVRLVEERVEVDQQREYKMAGVKWYGEGVFHRETVRGDEMSARYITQLKPGALIYNRLFAWKGAFAVVPSSLADCFVSNEFPQFTPDNSMVLTEYLYLFCMKAETIRAVTAASTGSSAVSRNRFREEFFLEFDLPLPPLYIQRKMVAMWQRMQQEINHMGQRATELKKRAEVAFLTALGLPEPARTMLPKAFTVEWRNLDRWSILFNQLASVTMNIAAGRYPVVTLGEIVPYFQYGSSTKANTKQKGTPILRMNNIVDGELALFDLKHAQLSDDERSSLILRDGDILINRTNSKELVGKCAVFHEQEDYVFASYLIRMRADAGRVVPDYLALVLNSAVGRQQVDMMSRQIGGQANINTEELRSIKIPLPPLDLQRKLLAKMLAERKRIKAWKAEAKSKSEQTRADVEAMITRKFKLEGK